MKVVFIFYRAIKINLNCMKEKTISSILNILTLCFIIGFVSIFLVAIHAHVYIEQIQFAVDVVVDAVSGGTGDT